MNDDTIKPELYTLKNGMQIAYIKNKCNIFRIELVIRAGMLQESFDKLGFAHFIEHLMSFFPSTKYPDSVKNQQSLDLYSLHINAWTSENDAGYYIEGSLDNFYTSIDLMFQNYTDPILSKEIFQQEKQAVIRELTGMTENLWYNCEHMMQMVNYKNTILEHSLYEEIDNISQHAKLDNILEYRKQFYCPKRTIVIITGNIPEDFNTFCTTFEQVYFPHTPKVQKNVRFGNRLQALSYSPEKKAKDKEYDKYTFFYIKPPQETSTYAIFIQFHIPFDMFDDRYFIVDFIDMILTNSMGSRLYYALRTSLGAIYNVKSEYMFDPLNKKYNNYTINIETQDEFVHTAIDYILLELYALTSSTELDSDDTIQKKNYINYTNMMNKCTYNLKKLTDIYEDRIKWNKRPFLTIDDIAYKRSKITDKDIIDVSRQIFNPDTMKIFYSGNKPILKTSNTNDIHVEFYKKSPPKG